MKPTPPQSGLSQTAVSGKRKGSACPPSLALRGSMFTPGNGPFKTPLLDESS